MTKDLLALVNNFSIVFRSYYVPEEQAVLHFKLEAWLIFVGDPLLKKLLGEDYMLVEGYIKNLLAHNNYSDQILSIVSNSRYQYPKT